MNLHRHRLFVTTWALCVLGMMSVARAGHAGDTALQRRPAGLRSSAPGLAPVIEHLPMTEKLCALTFDDGPDPRFTPSILKELRARHVKATFFMIGERMEAYPNLVRAVRKDGHTIGNHTFHHLENFSQQPPAVMRAEVEDCETLINRLGERDSHLFRSPRGMLGLTALSVIGRCGLTAVRWTVCADHHDAPTPDLMAARVVKLIRPGGIILMHDGRIPKRWMDVAALPKILDALLSRGYRFVSIPELVEASREEKAKSGVGASRGKVADGPLSFASLKSMFYHAAESLEGK